MKVGLQYFCLLLQLAEPEEKNTIGSGLGLHLVLWAKNFTRCSRFFLWCRRTYKRKMTKNARTFWVIEGKLINQFGLVF